MGGYLITRYFRGLQKEESPKYYPVDEEEAVPPPSLSLGKANPKANDKRGNQRRHKRSGADAFLLRLERETHYDVLKISPKATEQEIDRKKQTPR
jgi:hypothetical protein